MHKCEPETQRTILPPLAVLADLHDSIQAAIAFCKDNGFETQVVFDGKEQVVLVQSGTVTPVSPFQCTFHLHALDVSIRALDTPLMKAMEDVVAAARVAAARSPHEVTLTYRYIATGYAWELKRVHVGKFKLAHLQCKLA